MGGTVNREATTCGIRSDSYLNRRWRLPAVSPAGIGNLASVAITPPDDHFSARPNCRVQGSGLGRVVEVSGRPSIGAWIVAAAVIEFPGTSAAPDDHFSAGPDCRVRVSALQQAGVGPAANKGQAGGCPT